MTTWRKGELHRIAAADDLHIAPFRDDGKTYGTPTWIWSVSVDDALYVRGYNGQKSRWYQAAVRQKAGRVIAAGITKEVTFEPVEGKLNDRIDEAYRAKYKGSPYLSPMISGRARAATVRATDQSLKLANRAPLWLLPVRELMSVAVMVASYAGRRVDWRGHELEAEGFNPR